MTCISDSTSLHFITLNQQIKATYHCITKSSINAFQKYFNFEFRSSAKDVSSITFFLDPQERIHSLLVALPSALLDQLDARVLDPLGDIAPATGEELASA